MKRYEVGASASVSRTISESDVYLFAGITGDLNPAHMDKEQAKKGPFGERIVHGILTTGLISAVIGMQLPGPGTIYMEQNVKFLLPVKIGDTVTAVVTIADIIQPERGILKLETVAFNQNGEQVVSGTAVVKAP